MYFFLSSAPRLRIRRRRSSSGAEVPSNVVGRAWSSAGTLRDAELDAPTCGARKDLEREHVLAELGQFAEQELPSARRSADAEALFSNRAERSSTGDADVSGRRGLCHGPSFAWAFIRLR